MRPPTNNYPVNLNIPLTRQCAEDLEAVKERIDSDTGLSNAKTKIVRAYIEAGIKKDMRK